jgi:hypothetical protein
VPYLINIGLLYIILLRCFDMKKRTGRKVIWTKEKCAVEAKKYNNKVEFQKGSGSAYNTSRQKKNG